MNLGEGRGVWTEGQDRYICVIEIIFRACWDHHLTTLSLFLLPYRERLMHS